MKKILSVILALALIMSCVSVCFTAFAEQVSDDVYKVSASSPAIPMVEKTSLSTDNFSVEIGDKEYLGSELTLIPDVKISVDDLAINNDTKTIKAFKKGVYKVNATAPGGATAILYVVVRRADEDRWVIYDADFSDGHMQDDWTAMYYDNGAFGAFAKANSVDYLVEYGYGDIIGWSPFPAVKVDNGDGTYTYRYSKDGTIEGAAFKSWGTSAYLICTNEIFNSFSDYEIDAEFYGGPGYYGGYGLLGRAELTNSLLTNKTTPGMYVLNGFGQGTKRGVYKYLTTTSSYSAYSANDNLGAWSYANSLTVNAKTTNLNKYTIKFDGENITLSSKADTKNVVYTTTTDKLGTGTFGFHVATAFDSAGSFRNDMQRFSLVKTDVYLNNAADDMPEANEIVYYQIANDSPVLPMLKNTRVNIDTLLVQLTKGGSFISGKKLIWDITKNECGLYLDAASGNIMAYDTGYAYVTVSDGNNSLEIAVAVAETAEDKFNIFEYDFTTEWEADKAAGTLPWDTAKRKTDDHSDLDATTISYDSSKGGIYDTSDGSGKIIYLKDSGPVKNFKDYTISYTANYTHTLMNWRRIGAVGRIELDSDTGLITTASKMLATLINYNPNGTQINFSIENANALFSHGSYLMRPLNHNTDFAVSNNAFYDFSFKYDGNDVSVYAATPGAELKQIYSLADDTAYSSIATVQTNLNALGTGTVGIVHHDARVVLKNFSVSVDVDRLPELVKIGGIYEISKTSPALPMVVKTKVNTGAVAVQLVSGGEYVIGSELTWKVVDDTEDIVYETATGEIYAFETGRYVMEVTDGTNTTKVAVIVDETANSDFYLVDYDFTNMADDANKGEGKWIVQSVNNNTEFQEKGTGSLGTLNLTYNATYDGVYFNTDGNNDILYYSDDTILKLFTDYTVGVTATQTRDMANWRRFGIVGRIALGSNGLIDADSTYFVANINTDPNGNNMNFVVKGNAYLNGSTFFQYFQIDDTFTLVKNTTYDMVATYQGKDLIFYAGETGTELRKLYTLSQDTQANLATNVASKYPTKPGTIGLYGGDAHTYVSRVYASANIETLPNATPIVATETTNNTVYASVNHYIELEDVSFNMGGTTVAGDRLSWRTIRTPNYEINATTGEFAAYQLGTFTETVIYNGKEHTITFVITDDETVTKPRELPLVKITGDATVNIKPTDGVDTEYTLTIFPGNNKKLKVNTLKNGDTYLTENFDTTGRVFGFLADTPSEIYITAEYIEDNGQYNSAMLGATLNYEKSGIRFGARTDMIRKSPDENVAYLDDKVLVDGKVYTPTEIGMLLIPSALFEGELTVTTKYVQKSKIKKVVNMTEAYSDIAITLTNIPQNMYDTDISSRMYIAYDDGGVTKYVYGETIVRSFNGINDTILKDIVPSNLKITGSTSNDYDDDATTNSMSYKGDETITFQIKTLYSDMPVNGINLKWYLYQDGNATGMNKYSAVASGEALSLASEPLEISYTPKDTDKLKVEEGGFVYLVVKACDANGKVYSDAKHFNGGAVYNADAIDATLLKEANFDNFWTAEAADVEAFFTDEVKKDLNVTLDELNAGLELSYPNGDKISVTRVTGPSSIEPNYYCYDVRVEYGSLSGRAASGMLAIPKSGNNYNKSIGFAGYNTGSPASAWSFANYVYLNSEAHGIAFDDPDHTRSTYNAQYNEPGFLFNYDNLSAEEIAAIPLNNNEFYNMYIRNFYMTRFLHHLNLEDRSFSGNFNAAGGSMGGLQNLVNIGLDGMLEDQAITSLSINLAAWSVNMGGYTEGRLTGWQALSSSITNMCDPIHFASYVRNIKVTLDVGLGDLTSPITGNIAYYNAIKNNQNVTATLKVNQNKTHGGGDTTAPNFTVSNK